MKQPTPFHPILFGLLPPVLLYSNNASLLRLDQVIFPSITLLLSSFIFWLGLSFLLKNKYKAGLIISLIFFLFFSYFAISELLYNIIHSLFAFHFKRRFVLLIWTILLALSTFFLLYTKKQLIQISKIIDLFALILICLPLFQIAVSQKTSINNLTFTEDIQNPKATKPNVTHFPDIYYIILDSYTSPDVLLQSYGFNNHVFLNYLKNKGFNIIPSNSNYAFTFLSLPSSLNMEYVSYLDDPLYSGPDEHQLFLYNKVAKFLKEKGYYLISIGVKNPIADTCFVARSGTTIFSFSQGLLEMTPLGYASIYYGILLPLSQNQYRKYLNNEFGFFNDIPFHKSPKFIFAHIMCPHHPFVFDAHGKMISIISAIKKGRKVLYADQVAYTNTRIMQAIDTIFAKSNPSPIIIIQGDHGHESIAPLSLTNRAYLKERFGILNAYYFPEQDYSFLHKGITPVNTFRCIFNKYFNSSLNILPDSSYINLSRRIPYNFTNITDLLKK